jgi:hypothetical protein
MILDIDILRIFGVHRMKLVTSLAAVPVNEPIILVSSSLTADNDR